MDESPKKALVKVDKQQYELLKAFYENAQADEKSVAFIKLSLLDNQGQFKIEISWGLNNGTEEGHRFGELLFGLCNNMLKGEILQQIIEMVKKDNTQKDFANSVLCGWQSLEEDEVFNPIISANDTFKALLGQK